MISTSFQGAFESALGFKYSNFKTSRHLRSSLSSISLHRHFFTTRYDEKRCCFSRRTLTKAIHLEVEQWNFGDTSTTFEILACFTPQGPTTRSKFQQPWVYRRTKKYLQETAALRRIPTPNHSPDVSLFHPILRTIRSFVFPD